MTTVCIGSSIQRYVLLSQKRLFHTFLRHIVPPRAMDCDENGVCKLPQTGGDNLQQANATPSDEMKTQTDADVPSGGKLPEISITIVSDTM